MSGPVRPVPVPAGPAAAEPRGWLAVALSLVAPGVGHLYAGEPKRGVSGWLATRLVALIGAAMAVGHPGRLGLLMDVLVSTAAVLLVGLDARRAARATRMRRRWYQGPASIAVACGIVWVASLAWMLFVQSMIAGHLRVPTDTMAPTILDGERLLVAPRRAAAIWRGEIVEYRLWDTQYAKRVVGLPGDTLVMQSGTLRINGQPQLEPYAVHAGEGAIHDRRFDWQRGYLLGGDTADYAPTLATWGPLVVPPHAYFVLGDNRGQTIDSRYDGFLSDSAIEGRPVVIYFSRDRTTGRIRWSRIGRVLPAAPVALNTRKR